MRPETLVNGIYMRPLGKRETVALMSEVVRDHYLHTAQERPDLAIALADMALKYNPRDVNALLQKGRAYFLMVRKEFISKYQRPLDIPQELRARYTELTDKNRYWFERAEALGWREPSAEAEAKTCRECGGWLSINKPKERNESKQIRHKGRADTCGINLRLC